MLEETETYRKKMKLNLNLTTYKKINSKQTMDLNVKQKTIEHFEQNRRKSSEFKCKQIVLQLDSKRMIHKRKF